MVGAPEFSGLPVPTPGGDTGAHPVDLYPPWSLKVSRDHNRGRWGRQLWGTGTRVGGSGSEVGGAN